MGEQNITNLFEAQTIYADHKDLIHDVAYDFYGERMATCSSDQYVKVGYLTILNKRYLRQSLLSFPY